MGILEPLNTAIFYAVWLLVIMAIITITMYVLLTPIHDKQIKLQHEMSERGYHFESD